MLHEKSLSLEFSSSWTADFESQSLGIILVAHIFFNSSISKANCVKSHKSRYRSSLTVNFEV